VTALIHTYRQTDVDHYEILFNKRVLINTEWIKKVSLLIVAITLSSANRRTFILLLLLLLLLLKMRGFKWRLSDKTITESLCNSFWRMHYSKLATGRYIVSPCNTDRQTIRHDISQSFVIAENFCIIEVFLLILFNRRWMWTKSKMMSGSDLGRIQKFLSDPQSH